MLTFKQINFGKIDAKNELVDGTDEEVREFLETYYIPPRIKLEDFLKGKRYFITGLKGIGKTALLRYVAEQIKATSQNSHTEFFLFKSELTEDDRKLFSRAGRTTAVDANTDELDKNTYHIVWRWFLHRTIAEKVHKHNLKLFNPSVELDNYIELMMAPKVSDEGGGIRSLLPRLKKGTVEISTSPKLGLEFDWDNEKTSSIKLSQLLSKADNYFGKLIPGDDRLCLFFDELELGIGTTKQRERDASLIGDLVLTIDELNRTCRKKKYPLCIYAAVRSEVKGVIVGKEINKPLSDFGAPIQWHQRGGDADRHPLLEIVTKRLKFAERATGANYPEDEEFSEIWSRYFPSEIRSEKSNRYVLHQTWYRPRDIVRLLGSATTQNPSHTKFSQDVFDNTRKEYSTDCWDEIKEELTARYSANEIESITTIFTAYKKQFNKSELQQRCEECAAANNDVEQFLNKHKVSQILSDLYRLGVVGNIAPDGDMRWSFRGDSTPVLEQDFLIHNALRPHFSLK